MEENIQDREDKKVCNYLRSIKEDKEGFKFVIHFNSIFLSNQSCIDWTLDMPSPPFLMGT